MMHYDTPMQSSLALQGICPIAGSRQFHTMMLRPHTQWDAHATDLTVTGVAISLADFAAQCNGAGSETQTGAY